jgi:hypothetical protein
MPRIDLLDPTQNGILAEHLGNELRHLVIGQDEAIRQIVRRAIERLLVQPLSNLMASEQIHRADCIRDSHEDGAPALIFGREPQAVRAWGVIGRAA